MASKIRMARPTDPKVRDADIERKLQLYGIVQAFKNGKMPTNEQIDIALNSFLDTDFMDPNSTWNRKLSDEGRGLVKDFASMCDKAKILLLSKNSDNLFQEFVWHSSKMANIDHNDLAKSNSADYSDKDNATLIESNDVIKGMKDLGTLIITNGQFRKLLNDAVILLRDMATDVGTKAADKLRPNEDQLNQIDEPAPDDTWHEKPDMSKLKNARNAINMDSVKNMDSEKAAQLKEDNQDKIDQGKRVVNDRAGHVKDYMNEKIPEERRDKIILRLKKMVVEIQGHQNYQNAIDSLLELAENYSGYTNTQANKTAGKAKKLGENDHLQQTQSNLKLLIERFANNSSLDDLIAVFNDLYADASNDSTLMGWFQTLDTYIRKVLKQKGFILTDAATDEFHELSYRGKEIFSNNYKDYGPRFTDEFNYLMSQFANDPLNKDFGNSMTTMFNDLGTNESGSVTFKPRLVKDITNVILPEMLEKVRYVPLPRIEYTDHMIDVVVENLILESSNLMPNLLEIRNRSYMKWGRQAIESKKYGSFMVNASGIQCDLKDVSYYVNKKSGFPSITDLGIADLFLGYEGFSFAIQLSVADPKSRNKFFQVDDVTVSLKHLNIKLKKSKHKILFAFFKPILLSVMKPAVKVILERQIRKTFNDLDETAYRIHLEKNRMANSYSKDPDAKMPSVTQLYVNATKSELLRQKEIKEKEARGKKPAGKTNIAMTQEDSILRDIILPTGISSTRATKYREMALSGDRWMSQVFSLGNAPPSRNIPLPTEISRRERIRHEAQNNVEIANGPGGNDRTARSGTNRMPSSDTRTNDSSSGAGAVAGGAGAVAGATGVSGMLGGMFMPKQNAQDANKIRSTDNSFLSNEQSGIGMNDMSGKQETANTSMDVGDDAMMNIPGSYTAVPGMVKHTVQQTTTTTTTTN
ncbi:hypothetical protein V1512DRAFT_124806 [Lipomyces arxii]|uniref:uncharacterized protein n=1 Tax=Lipomyces arxii TaxID=56418 RepID=UPI0034CFFDFB